MSAAKVGHWWNADVLLPTDDREVVCLAPSGEERTLRYDRDLWWLPDKSMYVYFTPTHWREARQ